MKKAIIAIVTILYLGVSSGIAMEIHYCMGKKAGFEFYGGANDKCGKCGMKEKKGCCNDEHKFFKLNDSHKNVSNDLSFETPVAILNNEFLLIDFFPAINNDGKKINNHSPPAYNKPSAHILNCVFRI